MYLPVLVISGWKAWAPQLLSPTWSYRFQFYQCCCFYFPNIFSVTCHTKGGHKFLFKVTVDDVGKKLLREPTCASHNARTSQKIERRAGLGLSNAEPGWTSLFWCAQDEMHKLQEREPAHCDTHMCWVFIMQELHPDHHLKYPFMHLHYAEDARIYPCPNSTSSTRQSFHFLVVLAASENFS